MKILLRREIWNNDISVMMAEPVGGGGHNVVQPIILRFLEPGAIAEPMMRLQLQDAQLLMDELWNVGLRPSEGTGSAGALAATERHLADMRRLVKGLT